MLTSFVERDGMARTVLLLLGMTTIACLSYTWGYSEGMHNARTLVRMEQQHAEDVAAAVSRTDAEHKQVVRQDLSRLQTRRSSPTSKSKMPLSASTHAEEAGLHGKVRSGHISRRLGSRELAAAAAA